MVLSSPNTHRGVDLFGWSDSNPSGNLKNESSFWVGLKWETWQQAKKKRTLNDFMGKNGERVCSATACHRGGDIVHRLATTSANGGPRWEEPRPVTGCCCLSVG